MNCFHHFKDKSRTKDKTQDSRVFKFAELRQATSNFSNLLKISEGGFGCVYKATIKPVDGNGKPIVVAIKKLNGDGNQGHKKWIAELQLLGVVEHPNLVKLIGYCATDGERLLVYEYMPNKSLEDHLFSRSRPVLSWERRLQVMRGAAQGLAYLHEALETQVPYRAFNTSNVLLDEDFRPKLSGFGIPGEILPADHRVIVTGEIIKYSAPEYVATGHVTSKSNVWNFGVVLYEILTGRRLLEMGRPRSEWNLLEWVKRYPADGKRFGTIMDPRLENQYSISAARKISRLAKSCLVENPKNRPKMRQVVESLKQIVEVEADNAVNHTTGVPSRDL